VILIGMMGSGKSTVGRLLSELTQWPHHDNDDLVLRLFEATPRQILADRGEAKLREAESEALAMGLEAPAPCIVGAAAGTILDEGNRRTLREAGPVVWLRASATNVEARAVGAEHRPWLDTGGLATIQAAVADRDPLYASVAEVTVETDGRTADAATREIFEHLYTNPACSPWLPVRDPN
jgi:shikimate kinase